MRAGTPYTYPIRDSRRQSHEGAPRAADRAARASPTSFEPRSWCLLEDRRGRRSAASARSTPSASFYPGYMLVEMALEQRDVAPREVTPPKVTGFVGGARNPPPVPGCTEVRAHHVDADPRTRAPNTRVHIDRLSRSGEEVRLTEGPLTLVHAGQHRRGQRSQADGFKRDRSTMFGRARAPPELSYSSSRETFVAPDNNGGARFKARALHEAKEQRLMANIIKLAT